MISTGKTLGCNISFCVEILAVAALEDALMCVTINVRANQIMVCAGVLRRCEPFLLEVLCFVQRRRISQS